MTIESDDPINYQELARLTAVPRPTLRAWVHSHLIPHIRFERGSVLTWIADRRVACAPSLARAANDNAVDGDGGDARHRTPSLTTRHRVGP